MNQSVETIRTSVISIGENKGAPRLWLEGNYLREAGFEQGSAIRIKFEENKILVTLDNEGNHVISKKKDKPILDINNQKIAEVFDKEKKVQVIIRVAQIEIKRTYRNELISVRLCDGSSAEVFSGGGTMTEAAKQAGYKNSWAIEINEDYANIWQANHKDGVMHNCSVSDIDFDMLKPVELLCAGIPCEPFSVARRNQKDIELHENANLSMFLLIIIERINPRTIILEEVPQYAKSEIGMATIQAIKQMGYNVE